MGLCPTTSALACSNSDYLQHSQAPRIVPRLAWTAPIFCFKVIKFKLGFQSARKSKEIKIRPKSKDLKQSKSKSIVLVIKRRATGQTGILR